MRKSIVLLGDSVFDNQAYVPGEPDVRATLQAMVDPDEWSVELRAVDGHSAIDVPHQLRQAPEHPESRFFLSVGGNDALSHGHLLAAPERRSVSEALGMLYDIREAFRQDYAHALDGVRSGSRSLTAFTIYNPKFASFAESAHLQRPAEAALSFFNDVIAQEALRRGVPLIDLRLICDESEDFANPIEPSFKGGQKIARAIVDSLPGAMANA